MRSNSLFFSLYILISILSFSCSAQNDVAQTPPMGWNSWNYFAKNGVNEKVMMECMDSVVATGLRDAGYIYFVIDGGWRTKSLNEKGELVVHPEKFPNGIKPLVDYAHEQGLKFGLHTVPGTHDCGGDEVGSWGVEEIHIQQFIDWGVDFIKLDKCIMITGDSCQDSRFGHYGCWNEEMLESAYRKWRAILDDKASDIVLSISAYKYRDWNPEVANMSRTTGDIACRVTPGKRAIFSEDERGDIPEYVFSVLDIADITNQYAEYAKPGYWNDPDMLVTGDHGLNYNEQCSHFALWCIMSSPLILGNDPRKMTVDEKEIILNKEAIAINQDNTEQGCKVLNMNGVDIWKKNLNDGSSAILFVNRSSDKAVNFKFDLSEIGISAMNSLHDVINKKEYGHVDEVINISLEPHACKFLKIN